MKKALAVRHVHFEDLGLAEGPLAAAGYAVDYREAGAAALRVDELAAADLLVVLGGPIGVYDEATYPFLSDEIEAVRQRLEQGRPTLGICLGAQIMAKASGRRVYPSGVKELGWEALILTDAGRRSVLAPLEGLAVLHWHGDTFDLPEDAAHLAATARVPHQAFTLGRFALALQFHLEATRAGLERWYIGHAAEIAATPGVDVNELRRQAAEHAPRLEAAAKSVLSDWLAQLG